MNTSSCYTNLISNLIFHVTRISELDSNSRGSINRNIASEIIISENIFDDDVAC